MSRSILALIGAGCLCLTGCGTFSDAICGPIGGPVYYRGVRMDIEAVKEGGKMALMAADIPFSAVADTLLIPYYTYGYFISEANLQSRSETAPSTSSIADDQDTSRPASHQELK
jgi:uncharacterized protein YceK